MRIILAGWGGDIISISACDLYFKELAPSLFLVAKKKLKLQILSYLSIFVVLYIRYCVVLLYHSILNGIKCEVDVKSD